MADGDLTDIFLPAFRFLSFVTQTRAVNINYLQATALLRSSVCEFQASYSDYRFIVAEKHKLFKESFYGGGSKKEIRNNYFLLQKYSFDQLVNNYVFAIKALELYFSVSRARKPYRKPTVSVHYIDENDRIKRLSKKSIGYKSKEIENYTSYETVNQTGFPYLDNYTPATIKKNPHYKHGGLDMNLIGSNLSLNWRDWKLIARVRRNYLNLDYEDFDWKELIMPSAGAGDDPYKSHIVVPITFNGNDEKLTSSRLKEILAIKNSNKSILGYVSVDHPEAHFFDGGSTVGFDNADANVVYLFADMLSLYLVEFLDHWNFSSSVAEYQQQEGIDL